MYTVEIFLSGISDHLASEGYTYRSKETNRSKRNLVLTVMARKWNLQDKRCLFGRDNNDSEDG